jgi:uncharacterized RDD family membrane protein YckC
MAADGELRYCPNCAAEYYSFARECAECRVALLTRAETHAAARVADAHAQAHLDISTLDGRQSYLLQRRLADEEVPFRIARGTLLVPIPYADDARAVLAGITEVDGADDDDADDDLDAGYSSPYSRPAIAGIGVPVSRSRRAAAAVVDSLLFGIATALLAVYGVPGVLAALPAALISAAMLATVAATPGKLLLGASVVDRRSGSVPSPWAAAVRCLLTWVLSLFAALGLPEVSGLLVTAVASTTVILVLFGPEGRSVHDWAAGTVVVVRRV